VNNVLVFGGSGFIGSHLVPALCRQGYQVTIADIQQPQSALTDHISFKYCDVRLPIPADLTGRPDLVINLAAIAREPGYPDHEYYETNVKGAENITHYCEVAGVNEIWFTSSMSIYGPSETPCREDTPANPSTAYGKSKVEAERIHMEWFGRTQDRRLIITRPAVIFGAREKGNFTRLANSLKRGFFVYPGRKDTIKACGYVEDLVDSLFFIYRQPEAKILYNFSYPDPCTLEQICNAFHQVGHLPRPLGKITFPIMLFTAKVFERLNSMGLPNNIHPLRMYKLVRSTNIHPTELLRRGYNFPTDLVQGLRRWYDDNPVGQFV